MNSLNNSVRVRPINGKAVLTLAAAGAAVVLGAAIWGSPAKANDVFARATRKDCTACHVNVDRNALWLTRYGKAFRNNGCPGVRNGCGN